MEQSLDNKMSYRVGPLYKEKSIKKYKFNYDKSNETRDIPVTSVISNLILEQQFPAMLSL